MIWVMNSELSPNMQPDVNRGLCSGHPHPLDHDVDGNVAITEFFTLDDDDELVTGQIRHYDYTVLDERR